MRLLYSAFGVVSAHLQRLIFTWVLILSVGLKATLVAPC